MGLSDIITPARDFDDYATWIAGQFAPLTLITPTATLQQLLENAIRYWNTHSAYRVNAVVTYNSSTKRVQLPATFKSVVHVVPTANIEWIWNNFPLWTILGVSILDNMTSDLILMSEAFKSYRAYIGTNFQYKFEPNTEDSTAGGYLYAINLPELAEGLFVIGTRRILMNEDIEHENILDWVLRYWYALVKQVEGNTLRKSGIIDIKNDGQEMVNEGKDEKRELEETLRKECRWVSCIKRM